MRPTHRRDFLRRLRARPVKGPPRVPGLCSFGASLFALCHILIGPTGGYLSNLTAPRWLAATGVFAAFAAFGAFTVPLWARFRFRPAPADARVEL